MSFMFGVPPVASFGRGLAWPQLELAKTDKEVCVTAKLPGLDEKDIDLQVEDGVLTIRGEKKAEVEHKERGYSEHRYGRFERRIALPKGVDRDKASATVRNGVLTVTLPKSEAANDNVRRIQSMARPLEDMVRDLRPGQVQNEGRPEPAANDNGALVAHLSSALLLDALAIIEPKAIASTRAAGRVGSMAAVLCGTDGALCRSADRPPMCRARQGGGRVLRW
jgi:HSP20 family molecular chaperone IbpA